MTSLGYFMSKTKITFLTANFLFHFVYSMVLAYLPIVFKSYGLTDTQIGFIIGLYAISSMTLMLPMGFFSDYFSPKKIVIAGALLLALSPTRRGSRCPSARVACGPAGAGYARAESSKARSVPSRLIGQAASRPARRR